ncbi:YdcF family protein [Roseicyclus sp. F158]|uniref:YdcF family protein n=1 Tax=Tropicimonas omnivorans TaxID=3075590 RepID=A0ABU3DJ63_9RHOB|nr:YdcF family protein [Roseicyclus sp. F158]MDT0683761.1 YdcF family protein [Roseicyclus sp. F158]
MDTLFFIAAKIVGFLVAPSTWLAALALLAVLGIALERRGLAIWSSSILFCSIVLLAVLPLGAALVRPLEHMYPQEPRISEVDGIVVLGGGIDLDASRVAGRPELNEAGDRITAAVALSRRFPEARVLFTGGSGDLFGRGGSEADAARDLMLSLGLAEERLVLEGASRNTAENARLSRKVVDPQEGETWLLVTSAFHMRRAVNSFEAAGWPAMVPYPVDFRAGGTLSVGWDLASSLQLLRIGLRERVGLLGYSLFGR